MTVTVVTDTAASLPEELADECHVVVVPMSVTVGDRQGEQVGLDYLLEHLEEGVSTSAPSPGDFASALQEVGDEGAVVCTIASNMSATYDSANLAARLTDAPVTVVDTGTAAGAEGLVVLAAARAAAVGLDRDEVARQARWVADRVRLVAAVDGLDQLVRSGRVPQLAGWAGGLLGVQPLFEFRAGKVHRLRPAISRAAALDRLVSTWRRSIEPGTDLHVAALHAVADDEAERVLKRVREECAPVEEFIGEFSPVMVGHTGPGLVGLAWYWGSP